MNVPASAKYAIIREMTQRDNNLLNIAWLCAAAGVSRSGYYHYLDTEGLRQQQGARSKGLPDRFGGLQVSRLQKRSPRYLHAASSYGSSGAHEH